MQEEQEQINSIHIDTDEQLEIQHLDEIVQLIEGHIRSSEQRVIKKENDIIEAKKDQRENSTHAIGNLYDADEFEAMVSVNQYAEQVMRDIADYEDEVRRLARLRKAVNRPYFARIDFHFPEEEQAEPLYLGRFTITGAKAYDIKIFDWRSPVASMFYRYGVGEASYEAPTGLVTGTIERKRQYEIKDKKLEFYFDCDVEVMDEYLKQMLSNHASSSMKAIVETIQRDQDLIIRNLDAECMMVQGVAGSGKTSVALHRAAYLMYQGAKHSLTADNILILSPNRVFEQYISRVLPELGEDHVDTYVFEDLIDMVYHHKQIQTYRSFLELVMEQELKDSLRLRSFEFKTNEAWISTMKSFYSYHSHIKSARALYQSLIEGEQREAEIMLYTKENLASRKLYYEDALCIMYFKLLRIQSMDSNIAFQHYEEILNEGIRIKQVIIDEAQDYTPLHFEILKLLYPNADYTIVGDIQQTIQRHIDYDFYDKVKRILDKPKSLLFHMNKSFRCSQQILERSAKYLEKSNEVVSFCRDGYEPQEFHPTHVPELIHLLLEEIQTSREEQQQSIAILCENLGQAYKLQKWFSIEVGGMEIPILGEVEVLQSDVFLTPLYMAKGLEYDSVLVVGIEKKQHLYVACTRALHRLNLYMYKI